MVRWCGIIPRWDVAWILNHDFDKEPTMNCWHCERPAHGACIFCGRAICREHVREMPHIVALYRDSKNAQKAIVTARALFCGVCEPREDPVEIPELK